MAVCVAILALTGYAPGLILSSGAVDAKASALQTELPTLTAFIDQVRNGHADQITGVYADQIFAFSVVQQPVGEPAFISTLPSTLTQFAPASAYGSLGFVAHNTLAGRLFPELRVNSTFSVIYGDGTPYLYRVIQIFEEPEPSACGIDCAVLVRCGTEFCGKEEFHVWNSRDKIDPLPVFDEEEIRALQIRHLRAKEPTSTTSSYLDLDTGIQLSYRDLFFQTYGHPGWAILQTCMAANGMDAWGRLFIIADRSIPVRATQGR
jgi:hypothetical protein